jgi:hypothetical protein
LENQAAIWDACAGEGYLDSTRETFLRVLQRFADTTEPNRGPNRYYMNVPMAPPFLAPCEHPGMQQVLAAVLGKDFLIENLASDTPLGPGSAFQEFHRDSGNDPHLPKDTEPPVGLDGVWTLVVNVSLDDVTDDMGPFEIVPGTPTTDIASIAEAHGQHTRDGEKIVDAPADTLAAQREFPSRRITARKGDIVIRDTRIVHRGTPSSSKHARPALAYIFVRRVNGNSWGLGKGKNKRIHQEALGTLSPKARQMFSTDDCWEVTTSPLPFVGWNSGGELAEEAAARL